MRRPLRHRLDGQHRPTAGLASAPAHRTHSCSLRMTAAAQAASDLAAAFHVSNPAAYRLTVLLRAKGSHRTRGTALGPERLASTCPDTLRFHNASTAPFATCFPAAAIADVPRRKRSREDGRCPARTGDLLLVRRERVPRSTAACPWCRSASGLSVVATALAVCRFHGASTRSRSTASSTGAFASSGSTRCCSSSRSETVDGAVESGLGS